MLYICGWFCSYKLKGRQVSLIRAGCGLQGCVMKEDMVADKADNTIDDVDARLWA